jgi:hypothetical protein
MKIDLTVEEEARLREAAASRGTRPQDLAAQLVRAHLSAAPPNGERPLPPVLDERGVFHPERLAAVHQFFERASKGLPAFADGALTREAMYQDHD